jgi:hypothetical protein
LLAGKKLSPETDGDEYTGGREVTGIFIVSAGITGVITETQFNTTNRQSEWLQG